MGQLGNLRGMQIHREMIASNIPGSALQLPRDRLHIFPHRWTQATAAMYVPGEDRWSLVTSFRGEEAGALNAAQGAVQDLVGDAAAADVSPTRSFGNWSQMLLMLWCLMVAKAWTWD